MNTEQNKTKEAFKITGNWDKQSKQLKEEYPQLTDADLNFVFGKENDLLKRIGAKLNKKNEEVVNILRKGQAQPKKN